MEAALSSGEGLPKQLNSGNNLDEPGAGVPPVISALRDLEQRSQPGPPAPATYTSGRYSIHVVFNCYIFGILLSQQQKTNTERD